MLLFCFRDILTCLAWSLNPVSMIPTVSPLEKGQYCNVFRIGCCPHIHPLTPITSAALRSFFSFSLPLHPRLRSGRRLTCPLSPSSSLGPSTSSPQCSP